MASQSIAELVQVPVEDRDSTWLHTALQNAVELEFATLPIYLSGMWSIQPAFQGQAAYNLINSVVMEEMLHMGLACNMLVAIGGTPAITAPTFPSLGLPGNVLPELEVYLAGLSSATVQMYMNIEEPEDPVERVDRDPDDPPTIGMFYDEIAQTFQTLQPAISTDNQLTRTLFVQDPDKPDTPSMFQEHLLPITSVSDPHDPSSLNVVDAIQLIKDQGEGSSTSPDAPEYDDGELAHFYRFGEILHGKQLEPQPGGGWDYTGDAVQFPDCYPVARVPPEGYPDVPAVQSFNAAYATLIGQLEDAWNPPPGGTGGATALTQAVMTMGKLAGLAGQIVTQPLPGGGGQNYGPDFNPNNVSSQEVPR